MGFLIVIYMMIAIAIFGFNMMLAFNPMDDDERKRASRRAMLSFIWPVLFVGMVREMWKWSEFGDRNDPLKFPKERANDIDRLRYLGARKIVRERGKDLE